MTVTAWLLVAILVLAVALAVLGAFAFDLTAPPLEPESRGGRHRAPGDIAGHELPPFPPSQADRDESQGWWIWSDPES